MLSTTEKIAIFADCAANQIDSSTRPTANAFDNKCDLTVDLNRILTDTPDAEAVYKDYLSFKFRALLRLERGEEINKILDDEFGDAEPLGENQELIELKNSLDVFLTRDRNAYLARLSQLNRDAVITNYYFDHNSFREWAEFIEKQYLWYRDAFEVEKQKQTYERLFALYQSARISFVDEINLEYFERNIISEFGITQQELFDRVRERRLVESPIQPTAAPTKAERHILHLDARSQTAVRTIVSQIASGMLDREEIPTLTNSWESSSIVSLLSTNAEWRMF